MRTPIFLKQQQIERLHHQLIECFGGHYGIRDHSLWEAAIHHPCQVYLYSPGDLFDIASAYAYHIAQEQACFDGNKRTGIAAALLFLEVNGITKGFDSLSLYDVMIAIAEKKANKKNLAQLLRQLCS